MEETANKGKKKKGIKIVLIVIGVIVVLGIINAVGDGDTGKETDAAGTAETKAGASASTTAEQIKTPISVTADTLIDALDENALNAANTYKESYVKLTGKLVNIDSSGDYFSLGAMNKDFSFTNIMCYIKDEHLDAVSKFKTDQEVTVVGTITKVGEVMGYSLNVESIE